MENRSEFDADLLAPLPGRKRKIAKPSPATVEQEGADFMSFMTEMTA